MMRIIVSALAVSMALASRKVVSIDKHELTATMNTKPSASKVSEHTAEHTAADECEEAIPGSITRDNQFWKSLGGYDLCKCPDDKHVECPDQATNDGLKSIRTFDPVALKDKKCTCEDGAPVQFKGDLLMARTEDTCESNWYCGGMFESGCCCVEIGNVMRPKQEPKGGAGKNAPWTHGGPGHCHNYKSENNPPFQGFPWKEHCGVLCRGPTNGETAAFVAAIKDFPKDSRDAFWKGMASAAGPMSVATDMHTVESVPAHMRGSKELSFWDELKVVMNGGVQ